MKFEWTKQNLTLINYNENKNNVKRREISETKTQWIKSHLIASDAKNNVLDDIPAWKHFKKTHKKKYGQKVEWIVKQKLWNWVSKNVIQLSACVQKKMVKVLERKCQMSLHSRIHNFWYKLHNRRVEKKGKMRTTLRKNINISRITSRNP